MFNTILVAVDDSEAAKAAIELGRRLAKEDRADLLLVNIVDASKLIMVAGYETPYPIDAIQVLRDAGADLLNEAQSTCQADGLTAATLTAEGDACSEILRVADANRVGLICMGTHGRKGLAHLFVGSVAEGVVRRAKVPVIVTRPAQKQPAKASHGAAALRD